MLVWAPLVDIIEDETEWLLKADLPEVKNETLQKRCRTNAIQTARSLPEKRGNPMPTSLNRATFAKIALSDERRRSKVAIK